MERLSSRGVERERKNNCCSSCTKDFTDRLGRAAQLFYRKFLCCQNASWWQDLVICIDQ
jgi:hypothetical protein